MALARRTLPFPMRPYLDMCPHLTYARESALSVVWVNQAVRVDALARVG